MGRPLPDGRGSDWEGDSEGMGLGHRPSEYIRSVARAFEFVPLEVGMFFLASRSSCMSSSGQ